MPPPGSPAATKGPPPLASGSPGIRSPIKSPSSASGSRRDGLKHAAADASKTKLVTSPKSAFTDARRPSSASSGGKKSINSPGLSPSHARSVEEMRPLPRKLPNDSTKQQPVATPPAKGPAVASQPASSSPSRKSPPRTASLLEVHEKPTQPAMSGRQYLEDTKVNTVMHEFVEYCLKHKPEDVCLAMEQWGRRNRARCAMLELVRELKALAAKQEEALAAKQEEDQMQYSSSSTEAPSSATVSVNHNTDHALMNSSMTTALDAVRLTPLPSPRSIKRVDESERTAVLRLVQIYSGYDGLRPVPEAELKAIEVLLKHRYKEGYKRVQWAVTAIREMLAANVWSQTNSRGTSPTPLAIHPPTLNTFGCGEHSPDSFSPSLKRRKSKVGQDQMNASSSTNQAPSGEQHKPKWLKGKLIGRGGFGEVYQAFNCETGEIMAVKVITFDKRDPNAATQIKGLKNEIDLLKKLSHTYVVQYYYCEADGNKMNIFMENVNGGSILGLLQSLGGQPLSEDVVLLYTHQILIGLKYLHGEGVVHRDIKPANVLLTSMGHIKLADFGSASPNGAENVASFGMHGTPQYMPPEIIKQVGHSKPADIWSLGCTVMEMLTGKPPFSHLKLPQMGVMQYIASGDDEKEPVKLPDNLDEDAADFIRRCLQRDPAARPTADDLLRHPFITGEEEQSEDEELFGKTVKRMEALEKGVLSMEELGDSVLNKTFTYVSQKKLSNNKFEEAEQSISEQSSIR